MSQKGAPVDEFMTLSPEVSALGPVFVSYRQSDGNAIASELASLLRSAGVPVWRDATDLTSGDTERRLDQALASGLSGAVLLVTPDVSLSGVVKTLEVPTLLRLAEDPRFYVALGTVMRTADGNVDYTAAVRLLGSPTVDAFKQLAVDSRAGLLDVVSQALLFRASRLAERMRASPRLLRLSVQSRGTPDGTSPVEGDLTIRLTSAPSGRLPDPGGLVDLKDTLPLLGRAIARSGATALRISGGAHLSVAYALGSAVPTTLMGTVSVDGAAGDVWTTGTVAAVTTDLTRLSSHGMAPVRPAGQAREVLAYVDLLPSVSDAAYTRLLEENPNRFDAWEQIRPATAGALAADAAGALIEEVAGRLRSLVQRHDNAHLHLLLRCPYPVALLLGRLSNTVAATVYEWDDTRLEGDDDARPRYVPTLVVRAAHGNGPITEVLLNPATGARA